MLHTHSPPAWLWLLQFCREGDPTAALGSLCQSTVTQRFLLFASNLPSARQLLFISRPHGDPSSTLHLPPLHRATAQTREHPPQLRLPARPPPNAARPGPPRLWAPSGRGLAAVSAARPRRHSPPRRALRRRPAPAPARPPRAPGRRLREAARPRALRAGTGGPGGRSRPLSATWQRPAGPRCCGSTGPCCGRASASADTTTGARPCDPGGGSGVEISGVGRKRRRRKGQPGAARTS